MSNPSSKLNLKNFFVFNTNFGPEEGEEHKKILFYYPSDTDIDKQIKQVGLSEALFKFASNFTSHDARSLYTLKTRQLFLQPEPGYWMIMTLNLSMSSSSKENEKTVNYHSDLVCDSTFSSVLKQAYQMFKLFMGSFEFIFGKGGVLALKQRLEHFYTGYLRVLHLERSDILDNFNGIHFLPLDKSTYYRLQCFIGQLEDKFKCIETSAFLFDDQLVWSGLESQAMRTLYTHLVTKLFPSFVQKELQLPRSKSKKHKGRFVRGPLNLDDESSLGKIPHIFMENDKDNMKEYLLIIYKALSASLCIVIKADFDLKFEFFRRLDDFLGARMTHLAMELGDHATRRVTPSDNVLYRYVYFNQNNLAQKSTMHDLKGNVTSVTSEVMALICELSNDLKYVTPVDDGETTIRTMDGHWIVAKQSEQRQVFVVHSHKTATLLDVNEEVKRLCAQQFSNIFVFD